MPSRAPSHRQGHDPHQRRRREKDTAGHRRTVCEDVRVLEQVPERHEYSTRWDLHVVDELADEIAPGCPSDEQRRQNLLDGDREKSTGHERCECGCCGERRRGGALVIPGDGQYQRTESRQWRFRLQKDGESWVIASAAAR